ncbi:hypothetical protein EYF80_009355 [Liparis tanakae]|uniref:Uncharacterized protein n=1 Tax=Liparis tanakae TaxID=230148 RepID=A0A4Z2IR78_9TELE|nr:hypothetical protein EYF80_009355 [Liparis tanakae]
MVQWADGVPLETHALGERRPPSREPGMLCEVSTQRERDADRLHATAAWLPFPEPTAHAGVGLRWAREKRTFGRQIKVLSLFEETHFLLREEDEVSHRDFYRYSCPSPATLLPEVNPSLSVTPSDL